MALGDAPEAGRVSATIVNHRSTRRALPWQARWDPADDPQVACEDPTLVRQAGFTPHPVRIEQFDDYVRISYEEYGGVRTIYLDGRDVGSAGDSLVKLGRSTARYEDARLTHRIDAHTRRSDRNRRQSTQRSDDDRGNVSPARRIPHRARWSRWR